MSSSEPSDSKSVLYLQQIDVEAATKREPRIKLQIDGKEVEIQQEKHTGTWTPSRSLELLDASKITVVIKAGRSLAGVSFRRLEAHCEVSVQEATKAFWDSKESISRTTMYDDQPVTVTLKFHPSPTAETTRAAVQGLQTEMATYRVIMSDSTEQTMDLVFKHGALLADMNPIVSAIFSIAKGAFEVLKRQKQNDEMVSGLADLVGRILPFSERLLDDIVCEETDLLEQAVRKMCNLITDTADFICGYVKQSLARRAIKLAVSWDTDIKIKALQSDFTKLLEDLDRAVDVTTLNMAKKNEQFRLLDRLKPIDAASYQQRRSCMEGTRTAIINSLITWALKPSEDVTQPSGPQLDNMRWLYGLPGLGKTAVANSLCDRLHDSKSLGGSYFCRKDDPILREPGVVLPTLICRLAGMWSPYRKLVSQALNDDPQLHPDLKCGRILLKLAKSVQKPPPGNLVLVIDALDECGDPSTRDLLLKCLFEACSSVSWIKVIITSRPEHDIKTFFEKNLVPSRDLAADDETRDDIRLFTKQRMAKVANSRYLHADWPGEGRLEQIIERSGGLFIFVETVSQFVDDPDPEPLLAQVLDGELEQTNSELHKLYYRAIIAGIGRNKAKFRPFAQAVVVAAAYRPLPDDTLASLMGLERGVVRSWVDGLSSLLYRDGAQQGGIRVRHLSVIDFLTGPACPEEFRVVLQDANEELSSRCLTVMTRQLKFNICELETSCLLNTQIPGLDERVREKISDALQYGCLHWPSHLCADSKQVSAEISVLLDELLNGERLLYWIEVLSLMGKVPAAISALRQILVTTTKLEDRQQALIKDALWFLLTFSTPISASTPHIYVSALPFTPIESNLWRNTSNLFPKLMNVCKGRMKSWPVIPAVWIGHTGAIRSLACSPNGRHVISGSLDRTIRIWDAESGMLVGEPLSGHTNLVTSVAYSPDGQQITSGSYDQTIRIWDAESGAPIGEPLRGHTEVVCSVAYSPNGQRIISGSIDRTIRIWDVESGTAVGDPLTGHTGMIMSVAYSPDGRRIISGSYDNTVRIWDAESRVAVGEPLSGHTGMLFSVTYSPNGRRIASSSADRTIRIWDAETGLLVGEPLRGHTKDVCSIAFSPDSRMLVSSSGDETIRIWDANSGVAVGKPLSGHNRWVRTVTYSRDGRRIISGADDRNIRIWDAESGKMVGEPFRGHTETISTVACSPDGRHIISGSFDNTVRIWDAESGMAVGEPLSGHTGMVLSVTYSRDGQRILSGSFDQTIRVWDAESGVPVGEPLSGHTHAVLSLACSPDGRRIISGSGDKTIRIWDAESALAVGKPWSGHSDLVLCVAYSPDGRHVVSSSADRTVRIWDVDSGVALAELLGGHVDWIGSVAYSPDGRRIISGSDDNTIRIWDAESGVTIGEPWCGHTRKVRSVTYSPDGRHVLSGSDDSTIWIWDAETGVVLGEPLTGHTDLVCSATYSPDGQRIISCSNDITIRVWDAKIRVKYYDEAINHDSKHRSNKIPTTGGNFPVIDSSLAALSHHALPEEMLDTRGWICGPDGLLFWIPGDCRHGLTHLPIVTIPSNGRERCVRVDFTDFRYGGSWTDIYERRPMQVGEGGGTSK